MKEASQRKTRAVSFSESKKEKEKEKSSKKEIQTQEEKKDKEKMEKIFKEGQDFAKKLHTEDIKPKLDMRKEILEKSDWLYALYDQQKEEDRLAQQKKQGKKKTPRKKKPEGDQVVMTTFSGTLDKEELKALMPHHCSTTILLDANA